MTSKATTSGWVVRVTTNTPASGDDIPTSSSNYFNVAIADAGKAIDAVRKYSRAAESASIEAVKTLSSSEIAWIPLKTGQVKPA